MRQPRAKMTRQAPADLNPRCRHLPAREDDPARRYPPPPAPPRTPRARGQYTTQENYAEKLKRRGGYSTSAKPHMP